MRGFLRIGKVTGIPVSVHWTLAVIAWFLGVGLATGALPASVPHASTAAYWATASVGVVAFFLSILLHELAHSLVARRYGVQTDGIELWLLGGMARLNRDAPSPKADGLIAVAGPLASILVGAAFIGGAIGLDAAGVWPLVPAMIAWLGIVNIIIAVFNLLPARRSTAAASSGPSAGRSTTTVPAPPARPRRPASSSAGPWSSSACG
jgi:Zn-dependent protease